MHMLHVMHTFLSNMIPFSNHHILAQVVLRTGFNASSQKVLNRSRTWVSEVSEKNICELPLIAEHSVFIILLFDFFRRFFAKIGHWDPDRSIHGAFGFVFCAINAPWDPRVPRGPWGRFLKCKSKKKNPFRFQFFCLAMNWELNQRVGLENLVCKPPTSIGDMASLRRYKAKPEKILPRATPEEKISGSSLVWRFLIWRACCSFGIRQVFVVSSKVGISYH